MLKIHINRGFVNIIILSWGYMMALTAFQPMTNMQKNFLDAIAKEVPDFTGDGYVSLGIVFASFSISVLLSPAFATLLSSRLSVLIGAICNAFFLSIFFWPEKNLLYIASAIQGTGKTLFSIGCGRYITENSKLSTVSLNLGIFWFISELSQIIGNLLVYFMFTGTSFDRKTRQTIFVIFITFSVISCAFMAALRKPFEIESTTKVDGSDENKQLNDLSLYSAWLRMKSAFILVITPNMLLLSITFLYSGLVIAFGNAVYSSCIGSTVKMGEFRKRLVSLTGVTIGIGSEVGALFCVLIASRIKIRSGFIIIGLGFSVHIICYTMILFNLPNNAPFEETEDIGLITPLPILAIVGGILLGFGDACFNTQCMSIIGILYTEDVASAFAFYCFCQNLMMTISFVYSNYVGLHVQLIVLAVFAFFGTMCFLIVDIRRTKMGNRTSTDSNTQKNQT